MADILQLKDNIMLIELTVISSPISVNTKQISYNCYSTSLWYT